MPVSLLPRRPALATRGLYAMTVVASLLGCAAPPAPPADTDESIESGRLVDCAYSSYPDEALRVGAEGTTRLGFAATEEGRISYVWLLQSAGQTAVHKFLDDAAVASLESCRVKPFKDFLGRPVARTSKVEYVWRLEQATQTP